MKGSAETEVSAAGEGLPLPSPIDAISPCTQSSRFLDNYLEKSPITGHIWTVLQTPSEILQDLAGRIKARRIALGWPQLEAAQRAGVAYRTWRRLETEGQASLEDMVKAAVALRCEDALLTLVDERDALKKQVEDLSFDLSLKKIRIDYLEAVAAFSKPAETAVTGGL